MRNQYPALVMAMCLFIACTKETKTLETPKSPDQFEKVITTRKIYYISATGNSTNSGTAPDQAWDINKANTNDFRPGDIINILGTVSGSLEITESGLPGAPITIQGGKIESKDKHGIYLYNCGDIVIQDISVQGSGVFTGKTSNTGICFWSDDGKRHSNIIIDGVIAKGYSNCGIYAGLGMNPENDWISEEASINYSGGYEGIIVNNCVADSNGYAGINISGSWPGKQNRDIIIKNSSASHNRGIYGMQPNTGSGIVLSNVINGVIDSCLATNNGWEFGHANVGIWAYDADNVKIQNSKSFRNISTTGVDGAGFDLDGGTQNCILQNNLSFENHGAGYLIYEYGAPTGIKNNMVRYNISKNDGLKGTSYGGITIGGSAPLSDILIYNNTIVQEKGKAITKIGYNVQGILEIKNNILFSPEAPYLWKDTANNLLSTPLLSDKFIPLVNSPVIDKGIEIAGLPKADFYGNAIIGKRDIGAVEYLMQK